MKGIIETTPVLKSDSFLAMGISPKSLQDYSVVISMTNTQRQSLRQKSLIDTSRAGYTQVWSFCPKRASHR